MDWWMIEYDNKNSDSHVFMEKITDKFNALMMTDDGGLDGCGLYSTSEVSPDNVRFYVNPEGASIPGVRYLLSGYGAKECSKPTEPCTLLAGNNAEILYGEKDQGSKKPENPGCAPV